MPRARPSFSWLSALLLSACAAAPPSGPAPEPERAAAAAAGTRIVLQPDLSAARAAGEHAEELRTRLEAALLARAQRAPGVSAARIEHDGERLVLALEPELDAAQRARLETALVLPGELALGIVADPADGLDLVDEQARLAAWLGEHPDAPLSAFATVARADGGPDPALRWAELDPADPRTPRERASRCQALLVQSNPSWRFTAQDLRDVHESRDPSGFPAIGFELGSARKQDFGDFTEAHIDRALAIEVDGVLVSIATINDRLPGQGIVMGQFDAERARAIALALSAGALPAPVRVVEAGAR
jgi:hypothetical protein